MAKPMFAHRVTSSRSTHSYLDRDATVYRTGHTKTFKKRLGHMHVAVCTPAVLRKVAFQIPFSIVARSSSPQKRFIAVS
jgi:hypothetical protein